MNKILALIKERGWVALLAAAVNFSLTRLFGLRIVRTNLIAENTVARKVFSKCKLKYSDGGFYYLNPMPTPDDLNKYYSSLYWDSRAGKNYGVNLHDIVHYTILQEYISQHVIGRKVFLNFGTGHGGISNLLWLRR